MNNARKTIEGLKAGLIAEIREIVDPHLQESGYRTQVDRTIGRFAAGNSRPWKVWVPRGEDGKHADITYELDGLVIGDFEGFCEEGVVTEFGMSAAWIGYEAIPIEDLYALKDLAEKVFANEVSVQFGPSM